MVEPPNDRELKATIERIANASAQNPDYETNLLKSAANLYPFLNHGEGAQYYRYILNLRRAGDYTVPPSRPPAPPAPPGLGTPNSSGKAMSAQWGQANRPQPPAPPKAPSMGADERFQLALAAAKAAAANAAKGFGNSSGYNSSGHPGAYPGKGLPAGGKGVPAGKGAPKGVGAGGGNVNNLTMPPLPALQSLPANKEQEFDQVIKSLEFSSGHDQLIMARQYCLGNSVLSGPIASALYVSMNRVSSSHKQHLLKFVSDLIMHEESRPVMLPALQPFLPWIIRIAYNSASPIEKTTVMSILTAWGDRGAIAQEIKSRLIKIITQGEQPKAKAAAPV